jgi:hypothetical protein
MNSNSLFLAGVASVVATAVLACPVFNFYPADPDEQLAASIRIDAKQDSVPDEWGGAPTAWFARIEQIQDGPAARWHIPPTATVSEASRERVSEYQQPLKVALHTQTFDGLDGGLPAAAVKSAETVLPQTVAREIQRDIAEQQRIYDGLKSGELTAGQAIRLEYAQARINRMEQLAYHDGILSPEEAAAIHRAQNAASLGIYREKLRAIYPRKLDAQTADASGDSTHCIQKVLQRNIEREKRIVKGVDAGSITTQAAGEHLARLAPIDSSAAAKAACGILAQE